MFEWDAANETEVAGHRVTRDEAESVFEDESLNHESAYDKDGEQREQIIGRSMLGRILAVTYTMRGTLIRIVTAYPVRGRRRREYLEGR